MSPSSRRPGIELLEDPLTGELAEVRTIQPYQADKVYRCPGCNQEIAAGTGHLVVVPIRQPEERRHWHRPCFSRHRTRRPGREGGRGRAR